MPYVPSSMVIFGRTFLRFCQESSKYKTPCRRTKGADEASNQSRGEPDWIDSVATLMLWRELVIAGLPVTYQLTANGGDETDLRVQFKGNPFFIDINVKGTKAAVPSNLTAAEYGNLPVKCEELGLKIGKGQSITMPPEVRLELREGRPWAIADSEIRLADIYIKVFVHMHPFSHEHDDKEISHVHFTNWLPVDSVEFRAEIEKWNRAVKVGHPPQIPGIRHPGLWIKSGDCKPYHDLFGYLEEQMRAHGAPGFLLRWKRLDKECIKQRLRDDLNINLTPAWLDLKTEPECDMVIVKIPDGHSKTFTRCADHKDEVIRILQEGFAYRRVLVEFGNESIYSELPRNPV